MKKISGQYHRTDRKTANIPPKSGIQKTARRTIPPKEQRMSNLKIFRTILLCGIALIFFQSNFLRTDRLLLFATDYTAGTISVTTFDQDAQVNGSPVLLTTADTLILGGGTLSVSGNGTIYSAAIGSGANALTGFSWGTGGTVDLGSGVDLTVNIAASSTSPVIPLTQTGLGTLNLTGAGTQNFMLIQNSGTLKVTNDLTTTGHVTISGTVSTAGNFTTNETASDDFTHIYGTLTVGGLYTDNADQTTIYGTVSAQTATFSNGGLDVESGGKYLIANQAIFSADTAIINKGTTEFGANSQLGSTTVANTGTMTLGSGTIFNGYIGNSGTFKTLGDIQINYFTNSGSGSVNIGGNATFNNFFESYSGTVQIDQTANFNGDVQIFGGTQARILKDASFNNTLDIYDNAQVIVGGNVNSTETITVTNASLISDGNISAAQSITVSGTSTLGLSNRLQSPELGNFSSETSIDLASTTTVQTDLSGLSAIRQPTLLVHMTSGNSTDDFLVDGTPTNTTAVAALFGTSTALRTVYAVDNGAGYDIYGSVQSLGDYAQNEGLLPPAIEAGNAIDDLLNNVSPSNPAYDMAEDLINQTDKDAINQTLYNLAGGYGIENIFAMTLVNLGQAGSPFFQGNAAGLTQNIGRCDRTDSDSRCAPLNGQTEIWGAPFYQEISAGGNFFQPGFHIQETGLMLGVKKFGCRNTAGILFAYGAPELRQSGALSGYEARFYSDLNLNDFQFAAHWDHEMENDFRLSLYLGGGSQDLKLLRNAFGTSSGQIAMNQIFRGETSGNTLSFTAVLERPICLNKQFVLSPLGEIDCRYQWLYAFEESAQGSGNWQEMTNLSEGNFYSPVRYGKTQYERISARVGFRGEYSLTEGGIFLQNFYGTQLGGDDYALVPVSTLGGAFNSRIYGCETGRDSLNLGAGAWRYLNALHTAVASVNYNYYTLSKAQASNVAASFNWRY